MNKLPLTKRAAILRCLTDGMGIRATARAMEVSKGAIERLLLEAGEYAAHYSDFRVKGLRCPRIEFDEQHSYVLAKRGRSENPAHGDAWTFVCLASESKLVVSWSVGARTPETTYAICEDAAKRTSGIVDISTDGYGPYEEGIRRAFTWRRANFARVIKQYEDVPLASGRRPAGQPKVKRVEKTRVIGSPNLDVASTSYIENLNLTARQKCRRFARATQGHSKALEYHEAAVALHFWAHNFVRVHSTLTAEQGRKTTPAMMHGLADRPLSCEWLAEQCDPFAVTVK